MRSMTVHGFKMVEGSLLERETVISLTGSLTVNITEKFWVLRNGCWIETDMPQGDDEKVFRTYRSFDLVFNGEYMADGPVLHMGHLVRRTSSLHCMGVPWTVQELEVTSSENEVYAGKVELVSPNMQDVPEGFLEYVEEHYKQGEEDE